MSVPSEASPLPLLLIEVIVVKDHGIIYLNMTSKSESVKVVVRCRPMDSEEVSKGNADVVSVDESKKMISCKNPHPEKSNLDPVREFTFDATYGKNSKQEVIFEQTGLPILESVLEGYNGTIFAYGQTGTGKTFTMEGANEPEHLRGIVPRIIERIFKEIEGKAETKKHVVRASFLELYNEELIDLLLKPKEKREKLEIHEKPGEGLFVKNLMVHLTANQQQLLTKYNGGKEHRKVAETDMNANSSRSHCIFSIIIESMEIIDGRTHVRAGKLNLVDLAGSERDDKTNVKGDLRLQAIKINLSLTSLGKVIQHLVDAKSTHVPYRDSLLTRLLQDSLGGNTKTVMIANVGPSSYNYDQTLTTLKYANRAKSIKNDVKINEDPQDALIRKFQNQIKSLKDQLAQGMGTMGGDVQIVEKIIHIEEGEDIEQIENQFKKDQDKLKKKYQEEKKKIYLQKGLVEEEKNKLIKAIQQKEREQDIFKANQEKLMKKLAKITEKMVSGSEEEKVAKMKEEQLRKKQMELQQMIEKERRMQEEKKSKDEAIDESNRNYANMKEEYDDKERRIKGLIKKNKQIEGENKELEEAYTQEIEELQDRRRILQKELKLKNLILEYFIPSKELDSLQEKAFWSEERDEWMLPNLQYSGNSLRNNEEYKQPPREANEYEELTKLELDSHPNMYFVYTEEGMMRQMDLNPNDKKAKPKKGKSSSKRPASKRKQLS